MADAQDENENESVAEDDNLTVVNPEDIFAIAPALTDSAVIDYRTVSGSKLYRAATQKLAEPFKLNPSSWLNPSTSPLLNSSHSSTALVTEPDSVDGEISRLSQRILTILISLEGTLPTCSRNMGASP
jgi:hypothetical protein